MSCIFFTRKSLPKNKTDYNAPNHNKDRFASCRQYTNNKTNKKPHLAYLTTGLKSEHNKESKKMESSCSEIHINSNSSSNENPRVPLSEVVADCVKRWFKDTLKEAKSGDVNMQVLVGQMYYSGYGIARDTQKGRLWMTRAARTRSSVWKVSDKHPGYNASDSDSDELKVEA
ncbi:hypothetical protein ACOSP7_029157 [Xanthoceras sorbifolium]